MTRKLQEIGCKFSQTWQDTVVSRRNFRHSWITKMSNVILKPTPLIWNHQQMTTGYMTNIRSCNQSSLIVIDRTTSHESVRKVARPIAWSPSQSADHSRLVSPRSCAVDGTTLHEWSHDHVRPICDILWFVIAGPEFWTWPSTLLWPNLLVRSPTTSKINCTIIQQFFCNSSYFVVAYRL